MAGDVGAAPRLPGAMAVAHQGAGDVVPPHRVYLHFLRLPTERRRQLRRPLLSVGAAWRGGDPRSIPDSRGVSPACRHNKHQRRIDTYHDGIGDSDGDAGITGNDDNADHDGVDDDSADGSGNNDDGMATDNYSDDSDSESDAHDT